MPRTKARQKAIGNPTTDESFQGKDINEVLNDVDSLTSKQSARLEQMRKSKVDKVTELYRNICLLTNKVIGNMTVSQYLHSIGEKENILSASIKMLTMSSVSETHITVQNTNISAQKKTLSSALKNLPATGKTVPRIIRTRKRSSSVDSQLKPVNTRKRSSSVDSLSSALKNLPATGKTVPRIIRTRKRSSSVDSQLKPVNTRKRSSSVDSLSSALKNLPATGKTVPRIIRTRKRSSSVDSQLKPVNTRKRSSSVDSHRMPPPNSCAQFRTPSNQSIPTLPMITPKINPNMPLSILRRPNQGECALSLDGSPLLVSGVVSDSVASVSVPLPDGRIISILATEGIEGAELNLDADTREQLMILNRNLTKCLGK